MKNKEIMKKKNFWGLLAVLFVAVFAFAACSDDDDDDKTGTYEYQVINSFDGDIKSINKVSDAFKQAFGAESAPFTLTGTKSECNRKAKEYAMKAQAALANDGSFSAEVKLINVTTEELIHSFDIKLNENIIKNPTLHYELNWNGIRIFNAKGNRVMIERTDKNGKPIGTAFDDIIETDDQEINLNRIAASNNWEYTGYYKLTMFDRTTGDECCMFIFYFNHRFEVGNAG